METQKNIFYQFGFVPSVHKQEKKSHDATWILLHKRNKSMGERFRHLHELLLFDTFFSAMFCWPMGVGVNIRLEMPRSYQYKSKHLSDWRQYLTEVR